MILYSISVNSNIYLEVIGTRHVHSVNFNDLITGTQSSILSNEAIREDFLDYNTSLQITEIHFHLLHWYEYRAAINFSRYVHGYFLGMIGTVIYKAGIKLKKPLLLSLGFSDTTDYPEVASKVNEKNIRQNSHGISL